jgi:hypothetical protein
MLVEMATKNIQKIVAVGHNLRREMTKEMYAIRVKNLLPQTQVEIMTPIWLGTEEESDQVILIVTVEERIKVQDLAPEIENGSAVEIEIDVIVAGMVTAVEVETVIVKVA